MVTKPNILLVVWDACRLDAAKEYAPTLRSLAEDNLWFENAIAPAGTSLPSHTSMVTGTYPYEHGTYRQTHTIVEMPLLADLEERGYERYAVSANGFASPKYGFDDGFDTFYNTQGLTVYPEGLDLHRYARDIFEDQGSSISLGDVSVAHLVGEILSHPNRSKSLANVAAAGLSELTGRYPLLQRIPHRRFNQFNEFCYSPDQNTAFIESIIEQHSENPFFLFTNYMDPHHPYAPPTRYQRMYCGRSFRYRELSHLAERTHPFTYLTHLQEDGPMDTATLSDIRGLYAGEVRTADDHLANILSTLDATGLLEDTVVVVTADHGENLGETNRMGENRMGHICSASDHHLRVPLVVAHPTLEPRTVEELVSLKDLRSLFTDGLRPLLKSKGRDLDVLQPDDGVVSSQVPATSNAVVEEKYPELRDITRRHLSISYLDDWKVVVSSNGACHAWQGDSERDIGQAPEAVISGCNNNLRALQATESEERALSDAERSHLEALGYL